MDPATALAELRGLSTQVVEALIVGADGTIEAYSTATLVRAEALAAAGSELLGAAAEVRTGAELPTRVEVQLPEGGLFAVRESGRTLVATTVAEPTAALVVYDLRAALRALAEDTEA